MRNLLKSKKGFTLVEIVIVIAIIGILAMTLIPAVADTLKSRRLQAATEKARSVSNLMLSGIESGQIPTNGDQAVNLGLANKTGANAYAYLNETGAVDGNKVLITAASATDITKIVGIEKIYNKPSSNADLKDPMSRDVKTFTVTFNSGAKTFSIWGADPEGTGSKQLYVTTSPLTIFN